MLADLLFEMRDWYSPLNLFRYITVRAALAAITALLFSLVIGPMIIRRLRANQIGETIRTDGPESHQAKKGTPTMGGLIILGGVFMSVLLWARLDSLYIQLAFLATFWMGAVGFIDDYLKVIKKMKAGLIGRYKLVGQITLGLIIGGTLYLNPELVSKGWQDITSVPFFKNLNIDLGWLYIPFVVFIITGTSNAVNLTDGLDGLAAGLVAVAMLAFAGMAYISGNAVYSEYLNVLFIKDASNLVVYCMAIVGGAMGFLWYNCAPAEVFMGDTGSLALGSTLGAVAVLIKKEILLGLIGGVFVAEALSVIIQTTYFKYTRMKTGEGKRVFRMAPLHHHFELKGWPETRVVIRFWIVGILLALLTLTTFKVR
ncbi:MAG TPA: phospho-N-acetylmuramoyl-pentapeptide-transferase [Calditrichia bacterium]|nr:phospho-N-acetylmuramoyl-pentapeptide-transferase [Calditrichia bacterium]HQV33988.1 phospho-N-acetylmuramoyl-pentapeptide-transferase [Calditrichia bacterium]